MGLRVVSAVLFSPRGGSAHVARALARGLRVQGCSVTLLAGSRGDLGAHGDANAFYGDVHAVSFDPALASGAPLRFEVRRAPRRCILPSRSGPVRPTSSSQALTTSTTSVRCAPGAANSRRRRGSCRRAAPAPSHSAQRGRGAHSAAGPGGRPAARHRAAYARADRRRRAAQLAARRALGVAAARVGAPLRLVIVPAGVERARTVLGAARARRRAAERRGRRAVQAASARPARLLATRPGGGAAGVAAGRVARRSAAIANPTSSDSRGQRARVRGAVHRGQAARSADPSVRPCAAAAHETGRPCAGGRPSRRMGGRASGAARGSPGRRGVPRGLALARGAPRVLSAADAVVLASEREQFEQVLVEGMACGLPAVATRSLGPAEIIENGRTGWLVEPDEAALRAALVEVVEDARERKRRGRAAREAVCKRFTWPNVAAQLAAVLEDAVAEAPQSPAIDARSPRRGRQPTAPRDGQHDEHLLRPGALRRRRVLRPGPRRAARAALALSTSTGRRSAWSSPTAKGELSRPKSRRACTVPMVAQVDKALTKLAGCERHAQPADLVSPARWAAT